MISIMRCATLALFVSAFSVPTLAQDDYFFPGADYDPSIPTFEDVLGYAPGERITWHRDATVSYTHLTLPTILLV